MAGSNLEWILSLKDQFSPAATKATASIARLKKQLDAFNAAVEAQQSVQERLNKASEAALAIDRQRTTQARKLAGQLDKVVAVQKRADSVTRKAQSVSPVQTGWGDRIREVGGAISAGQGGVKGIIGLAASGGGSVAVALAGVAASVAAVAGAAYGAAKAFSAMGSAAIAASKWAVEGLQFKESSLASLQVMTGSRETAGGLFSQAMGLAGKTPFGGADMVSAYKALMGAGFQTQHLSMLTQAIGDVSALNNFDKGVFQSLPLVFGQIQSLGKLTTQDMRQMLGATGGIVGQASLFNYIAQNMGTDADSVEGLVSSGKVSSTVAINAFLRAIQEKVGGKVGGGALAQSKTLAGQLSTLRDAPMNMLFGMDMEKGGFAKLKGFIENLNKVFDTTTESGKRFQALLTGTFDRLWTSVFGDLSGPEGLGAIEDGLKKAVGGFELAFNVFMVGLEGVKGAASGFVTSLGVIDGGSTDWEALGAKIGKAGNVIGSALGGVVNGIVWVADTLASHPNVLKFLGLLNPVTGPASAVAIGSDVGEALKGIADDSRHVTNDYGTSDDPAFFAEGGIVSRPTNAIIGEAGPEAIIPLKRSHGEGLSGLRGMGGGVTVNVTLNVDARGNADGDGIARTIANALPSAIADALESLVWESGGAF